MSRRGHIPPSLEGRVVQAPGLMRRGPFPPGHRPLDRGAPPHLLENRVASQEAEIEQLVDDNRRLAATHVALRQDLGAAQQEVERLKAHIRSIHTESDIQIRVLLDKTAKLESEINAGENVKEDLKEARMQAQSLVKAGQELTTEIQKASQELQKVHADVKSLPDLHAELDNLRREYKRLRATFEYEKGVNIEKVAQLQATEQNLIGMAREVEKLHAEVLKAEKKAHASNTYSSGFVPDPSYRTTVHGGGVYTDAYGRPLVQMSVAPAVDGVAVTGAVGDTIVSNAAAAVPNSAVVALWGRPYDPSFSQK